MEKWLARRGLIEWTAERRTEAMRNVCFEGIDLGEQLVFYSDAVTLHAATNFFLQQRIRQFEEKPGVVRVKPDDLAEWFERTYGYKFPDYYITDDEFK